MKPQFLVGTGLLFLIVLTSAYDTGKPVPYHSHDDMARMLLQGELPITNNGLFTGSGKCNGCHGHDILENANITEEGLDVNMTDDWRATMMANAAKDPFWQAKVTHEVAINPQHQEALEDKCTSCHAPLGKYGALHAGDPHYSFADLVGDDVVGYDSLAMDGVSCGACHQQRPSSMGFQFSGVLDFSADTIWGPYISDSLEFPLFFSAMNDFVGFMPVGHEKVPKSELCAGCHTLQTHSVDLDGNFTGTDFVEQATYHEWLNSDYNNNPDVAKECQGCHMPRLEEPIVIAAGYAFLPGRSPYGQHWLVGANSFMLELMKNRIDQLHIAASPEQFDKVINRTLDQLTNHSATLAVTQEDTDGDTARFRVRLTNLAGHKFPSGYPSRRAYIEFTLKDSDGNILWQSGGLDPYYEVFGQNPDYEPHYDLIKDPQDVQIYELVMGDVNNNVTTVLERAYQPIKDNRLVPLGFSTTHYAYDTTAVVGSAATDPNFNWLDGMEGSGTDDVFYHIPVTGIDGQVIVSARLMYQSLPPKWNQELFSVSTPQIDAFEEMYWEEGPDPVQVASAELSTTLVTIQKHEPLTCSVSPNPSDNGEIVIQCSGSPAEHIVVYSSAGKMVGEWSGSSSHVPLVLPDVSGTYIVLINTGTKVFTEKVIRR